MADDVKKSIEHFVAFSSKRVFIFALLKLIRFIVLGFCKTRCTRQISGVQNNSFMSQSFDMTELSVHQLSDSDLQKINGGWWQAALAIAGAAIYIYNNAEDFVAGFNEGYQDQQKS